MASQAKQMHMTTRTTLKYARVSNYRAAKFPGLRDARAVKYSTARALFWEQFSEKQLVTLVKAA